MTWSLSIWEDRYKQPGDKTTGDTMARVATAMARGPWDGHFSAFLDVLERGEFVPGGRIIANAGTPNGMLLNCFNVPIHDSRHGVFRALTDGIEVLANGGGVGFNFSRLRASGSKLRTTGGTSQGPIPFIDIFDESFNLISKSYKRSAAAIAVLSIDHPDVLDFIHAKRENGTGGKKRWSSMNVSVDMSEEFIDEMTGLGERGERNKTIWDAVVDSAYECGDPGFVFLNRAQRDNNLDPKEYPITGVNPCGEVPLMDYGACCLGSINLSNLISGGKLDYDRLNVAVGVGVDFLTSVLFTSTYPTPAFEHTAHEYRRIGLGITGLAHALIKAGLVYGSDDAVWWTRNTVRDIALAAYKKSAEMANRLGKSVPLRQDGLGFFRNVEKSASLPILNLFHSGLMAVAPTGSTSMLAHTSPGIEPIFAMETDRTDRGVRRVTKDPLLGEYPRHLFRTALEVTPDEHLKMLLAVQNWVDGSVSKTINLPEDMGRTQFGVFLKNMTCASIKGATVYRDKSLGEQVVSLDQPVNEGRIYEIPTPSGNIYVPIGWDSRGRIRQVFINMHKPGGEEFALASALGRVISIALQEGASVERLVETLAGIGGGQVIWTTIRGKQVPILSVPDAVAKVLADRIGREDILTGHRPLLAATVDEKPTVSLTPTSDVCPNCRIPLARSEGCLSCSTCGHAECSI